MSLCDITPEGLKLLYSKVPTFHIQSGKNYTGQKKFTQTPSVVSVTNMRYDCASITIFSLRNFDSLRCICFFKELNVFHQLTRLTLYDFHTFTLSHFHFDS